SAWRRTRGCRSSAAGRGRRHGSSSIPGRTCTPTGSGSRAARTSAVGRRSSAQGLESKPPTPTTRPRGRGRPPANQPGRAWRGLSKIPKRMSSLETRRGPRHSTPQCVDEGAVEVLEQRAGVVRRLPAEEALDEQPVQRGDDERRVLTGAHVFPEDPLLPSAVDDVGEQASVDALELVHVADDVVGMLLLAQDQADDELDGVDVLRDEIVVGVDQALDLVELREPLELVDDVDEVRLERALERRPEELLLVLEV